MDIDPDVVERLVREYPPVTDVSVRAFGNVGWVTIHVAFRTPEPLDQYGYPDEAVHISLSSQGKVYAFPCGGGDRTWEHRNPSRWQPKRPSPNGEPPTNRGDLCFQYQRDSDALRWMPGDSVTDLVRVIHRHLLYEEGYRRGTDWPVEDTPHEPRENGEAHPILMRATREVELAWQR